MLEHQFITFYEKDKAVTRREMPLPVVLGGKGISFYLPGYGSNDMKVTMGIARADGTIIYQALDIRPMDYYVEGVLGDYTEAELREKKKSLPSDIVRELIAPGECFRLVVSLDNRGGNLRYSNLLRRTVKEGLSFVEYTCDSSTFGFPFKRGHMLRVWLPIHVSSPEYNQKDNIYEKLNGERVVLFASINREYLCETEYITDEWHKKLIVALSCDRVYINQERLTKSDKYEIDWENYFKLDDGEKCAKATWKMCQNVTQRNSI